MLASVFFKRFLSVSNRFQPANIKRLNQNLIYLAKCHQTLCLQSTDSRSARQNNYQLIYYGVLTPQIKAVKLFSFSSSVVGLIAQPFLYQAVASTGSIPVIVAAYSFIGFFTFVTPFLLHMITKKYVTELVHKSDTDTYLATTINFFCISKKTEFKVDDIKVPDIPGMFTTLIANGKPMFFDPRMFHQPSHYARLMGYDKPMDFKLVPIDKK